MEPLELGRKQRIQNPVAWDSGRGDDGLKTLGQR